MDNLETKFVNPLDLSNSGTVVMLPLLRTRVNAWWPERWTDWYRQHYLHCDFMLCTFLLIDEFCLFFLFCFVFFRVEISFSSNMIMGHDIQIPSQKQIFCKWIVLLTRSENINWGHTSSVTQKRVYQIHSQFRTRKNTFKIIRIFKQKFTLKRNK